MPTSSSSATSVTETVSSVVSWGDSSKFWFVSFVSSLFWRGSVVFSMLEMVSEFSWFSNSLTVDCRSLTVLCLALFFFLSSWMIFSVRTFARSLSCFCSSSSSCPSSSTLDFSFRSCSSWMLSLNFNHLSVR